MTSRAGTPRRVSSRAAQARARSISGARTRTLPPVASASPIRRSTRSRRSGPVTSSAGPARQAGGGGGSAGGAPERMPGGSARNAASPQALAVSAAAQRVSSSSAGVSAGTGSSTAATSSSVSSPGPAPGSTRDHHARTRAAAEGNAHALSRGDPRLQLGRDAIREGPRNGKVGDDVREQEVRPQAPAGARTRSSSRRMSLRSSNA